MDKLLTQLADFSFRRAATPLLVRFIYVFAVILCAIQLVLSIVGAFSKGVATGVVVLVVAPVLFFFLVCCIRLALETAVSMYRTANYLAELARATRKPEQAEAVMHEAEAAGGDTQASQHAALAGTRHPTVHKSGF